MNDFKLTEEKAMEYIESIEKVVEEKTDSKTTEMKSLFKEDFMRLDLKIEQFRSGLELKMKDLEVRIESTKNETLKWFIGGFVVIVLMVLGLYFKS